MLTTYDSPNNWANDPYGYGDSAGLVATTGYTATGVVQDDGVIGSPQQQGDKAAGQSQNKGNPIVGFLVLGALVFLLIFLTRRFGKGSEDFSNIRGSLWDVLIIALAATAGIPIVKLGAEALAGTGVPFSKELNGYVSAA